MTCLGVFCFFYFFNSLCVKFKNKNKNLRNYSFLQNKERFILIAVKDKNAKKYDFSDLVIAT